MANIAEVSYPGGIHDDEKGASLTGSTTLVKTSKDVLGGVAVVIDFGIHQGSKNANELNKMSDEKVIDIVDFKNLLDKDAKNDQNFEGIIKKKSINIEQLSKIVDKKIDFGKDLKKITGNLDIDTLKKLINQETLSVQHFINIINEKIIIGKKIKLFLNNISKDTKIIDKNTIAELIEGEHIKTYDLKKNVNKKVLYEYELSKISDDELINADYIIITHAHMDHIGRLPLLVKKGFKGKILMTKITKELAELMLTDYISLTLNQIKQLNNSNKKKVDKLKGYIQLLDIDHKLKNNTIDQKTRASLRKKRDEILDGGNLEKLIKESIDSLKLTDIEVSKILTKNQADSLLDIEEDILKISKKRDERIKQNKLEFDYFLDELIKLNSGSSDVIFSDEVKKLIEKNNVLLELYPIEIRDRLSEIELKLNSDSNSKSIFNKLNIQKNILENINLTGENSYSKSKSGEYKKEKTERAALIKKRNKIIGDKDLSLCIEYSKKILGRSSHFDGLNNNIPELLFNEADLKKTLSMIETMEVGQERRLDSRIVITKKDSEVIDRIPDLIKDGYDKKIYVLPHIKQYVIDQWERKYRKVVDHNKKSKLLKAEFDKAKKFISRYNKTKNGLKLQAPEGKIVEEYYNEQLLILENSEINQFTLEIEDLFKYVDILESGKKYFGVADKTEEDFDILLEEKNNDIISNNRIFIGSEEFKVSDLSEFLIENKRLLDTTSFYENIEQIINSNDINNLEDFLKIGENPILKKILKKLPRKSPLINKLQTVYKKYEFYKENQVFLDSIFADNSKKINEIKSAIEKNNKLNKEKVSIVNNKNLLIEYQDFKKSEHFFKLQVEKLKKYGVIKREDIEKAVISKFCNKKLPFTKKEIEEAKKRLEIILEKNNEKIVESLKVGFYNAGHIQGSIMASLTFVTKEVRSKVNGILGGSFKRGFNGTHEILKKYVNLGFSGDLGKNTQPNMSGRPDVPDRKYDYFQMESTYADREHPDKLEEFSRLINILNNSKGKVLIAAFSLQRTQEIISELLNDKLKNKGKIEEYKKLKIKEDKFKKRYNTLKSKSELTGEETLEKEKLFKDISDIEIKVKEASKGCFLGFLIQDSPLASRVSEVFIKNYPDLFGILDPLLQKSIFGKEQVRVLGKGEHKDLYDEKRSWSRDIIISSGGMMQGGAIINHLKKLVSDSNATIILSGYVAEGTLARELLEIEKKLISAKDGKKQIIIDGDSYDVNCKIESIGGFSSHIGQTDAVNFVGKSLNFAKNAVVSLTHGDETRGILKTLIESVNSKINIIIPKLGDKNIINL